MVKLCQDSSPTHIPQLEAFVNQLSQLGSEGSTLNILESNIVSLGSLAKFRSHFPLSVFSLT